MKKNLSTKCKICTPSFVFAAGFMAVFSMSLPSRAQTVVPTPTTAEAKDAPSAKVTSVAISETWIPSMLTQAGGKYSNPKIEEGTTDSADRTKKKFKLSVGNPGLTRLKLVVPDNKFVDLSATTTLRFWIYNDKKSTQKISIQLSAAPKDDTTKYGGWNQFVSLDFEGWKEIKMPYSIMYPYSGGDLSLVRGADFIVRNPDDKTPTPDIVLISEVEATNK